MYLLCSIVRVTTRVSPTWRSVQPSLRHFSLGDSSFINSLQDGLLHIHTTTGAPWWATIITGTILVRSAVTLPLRALGAGYIARYENNMHKLQKETEKTDSTLIELTNKNKWTTKEVRLRRRLMLRKMRREFYKEYNCSPNTAKFFTFCNLPVWVCMTVGLRSLAEHPHTEDVNLFINYFDLMSGGCLWFPNLLVADPYYVIPALIGCFGLFNIYLTEIERKAKVSRMSWNVSSMMSKSTNLSKLTYLHVTVTCALVGLSTQFPTVLTLFWLTSFSWGVFENFLFMYPPFKRLVGIPFSVSESPAPFRELSQMQKQKFKLLTSKKN